MKKLIAAAAAIMLTCGLCGCSSNSDIAVTVISSPDSGSTATAAGLSLTFPKDWEVCGGYDIYKMKFEEDNEGYDNVDDFKKSYEEIGLSYLVYAASPDLTAILTLSALEITADSAGQRYTAEEYARSNHDTAIISFQSVGYMIENSSFSAANIGGKDGFLSKYEVLTGEDEPKMIMGQAEFTFEHDGCFYSLQSYYHSEEAGQQTAAILDGASPA